MSATHQATARARSDGSLGSSSVLTNQSTVLWDLNRARLVSDGLHQRSQTESSPGSIQETGQQASYLQRKCKMSPSFVLQNQP